MTLRSTTRLLIVGDQDVRFRASGQTTWTNQVTDLPTNAPPAWVYLSAYGVSNSWLVAGRTGLLIEGSRTNGASLYTWQPSPDSSHAWLWDVTVQEASTSPRRPGDHTNQSRRDSMGQGSSAIAAYERCAAGRGRHH